MKPALTWKARRRTAMTAGRMNAKSLDVTPNQFMYGCISLDRQFQTFATNAIALCVGSVWLPSIANLSSLPKHDEQSIDIVEIKLGPEQAGTEAG